MFLKTQPVLLACMWIMMMFAPNLQGSGGQGAVPLVKKGERELHIPILAYHDFTVGHLPKERDPDDLYISVTVLEENIKTLLNEGYSFIDFEDLYLFFQGGKVLPEKPVILTCDDGYIGNYRLAYPIFLKYGVKATIFVVDSQVGEDNFFSWEQARKMERSGLVDICTHGKNHIDYSKVSEEQLVEEITQAYENIADKLGGTDRLKIFAYPYGANSEESRNALKEKGFAMQVITRYGHTFYTKNANLTQINRIKCWNGLTGKDIIEIVQNDEKG